jgi:hypothetical protein
MKKSKSLSWVTIASMIVIVACVVLLVVRKNSLEKALVVTLQKTVRCEDEKQQVESKIRILESNVILAAQSTGISIDDNIILTDVNNNKHTAKKVLSGKTPCLVFRYSYGGCSPCIQAAFEHLQELKSSIDPNKLRIVIIPYNMDLKQMIIENSLPIKDQFKFYLADEDGLKLPIDKAFGHYLFVADQNKTSNVMVVDVMFRSLLEKYFEMLIEKYK